MAKISRNFYKGRMNKSIDERILPQGEYIDAQNIRVNSAESSGDVGVVNSAKGNVRIGRPQIRGEYLSANAKTLRAYSDDARNTIYWFVHDPSFTSSESGKADLLVSYNSDLGQLKYHIISEKSITFGAAQTTLNFSENTTIYDIHMVGDVLYWCSNEHPPRCININKYYDQQFEFFPGIFADNFEEWEVELAKEAPPTPVVTPLITNSSDNFMEEKFICFAYRWRYENDMYSATSPFSDAAFIPTGFAYSPDNFLNDGMTNKANSAEIKFNTGSRDVVGVDILYKENNASVIKVIESINKEDAGYEDFTEYTTTFKNDKALRILPNSEILRLFDSVPYIAKAQTVMGNRLVFGNYQDKKSNKDQYGRKVKIGMTTSVISEALDSTEISSTTSQGTYNIDGSLTKPNSVVNFDLSNVSLDEGSVISLDIRLNHNSWSGTTPPSATIQNFEVSFTYYLTKSYNSVYELASSDEFIEKIGSFSNTLPMPSACNGGGMTNEFNCGLPATLDTYEKYVSGIDGVAEPIRVITSTTSNSVGLQFPAIGYADDANSPTNVVYAYLEVVLAECFYQGSTSPKSLHSNRDYEVYIAYMDNKKRFHVAESGRDSAVYIAPSAADKQNKLRVTIPATQTTPSWAESFKFFVKPSSTEYNTIFSNIFYKDPESNATYFLLEGENSRKIEAGDRLIVKTDTTGALSRLVYATVLEKEAKEEGFITTGDIVPAGAYMKIVANDFQTERSANSIIDYGNRGVKISEQYNYPIVSYPAYIEDPDNAGQYIDYDVPAGSRIKLNIRWQREGTGDGSKSCERRKYFLTKELISSKNYDNLYDFFVGDNVQSVLNDGSQEVGGSNCGIENVFQEGIGTSFTDVNTSLCTNYLKFYRDASSNKLFLGVSGTSACGRTNNKSSHLDVRIEVLRTSDIITFETEPNDSQAEILYEGNQEFAITNNNHEGNVQNQDISTNTPAIIDLDFYNCYTFGNGVESYKIRDSIVGRELAIGNRAWSNQSSEVNDAFRSSDLTYSGVYNLDTNVNNLNNFNLGLLNYKMLEQSFGDVKKIDGRKTDILVLQSDKISYVLAGKNLLSDSTGGGQVSSVPEVLGTQIARVEENGISNHPESYAVHGSEKIFLDSKRGVLIQLLGSSAQNEQMNIISDRGMKEWFRDLSKDSSETQKLGGFDSFNNEYVLASTNKMVEQPETPCYRCGLVQIASADVNDDFDYCIELEAGAPNLQLTWPTPIGIGGTFNITAEINGTSVTTGDISLGGSLNIPNQGAAATKCNIKVTATQLTSIEITSVCAETDDLDIVQVVISSNSDVSKSTHIEYFWNQGTFNSPISSTQIQLLSSTQDFTESYRSRVEGKEGVGSFPLDGSTVKMLSSKIGNDDFDFNTSTNKLRYLRSDTWYPSTNIAGLLADSTSISVSQESTGIYSGTFTMPATGNYLYLVWDLRKSKEVTLEFDTTLESACC